MNLSETLDRAKSEATDTTEKGQALAKEGFRELSSRVARVLDRVDGLGIDTFLRFAGLTRRSSSLMGAAGTFTAGLAVGAGLGVLFAPSSGVVTRRRISRYFGSQFNALDTAAKDVVEEPVQKVKEAAHDLGAKVEKTADDMKTRVDQVLHMNDKSEKSDKSEKDGPRHENARAHRPS